MDSGKGKDGWADTDTKMLSLDDTSSVGFYLYTYTQLIFVTVLLDHRIEQDLMFLLEKGLYKSNIRNVVRKMFAIFESPSLSKISCCQPLPLSSRNRRKRNCASGSQIFALKRK